MGGHGIVEGDYLTLALVLVAEFGDGSGDL